MYLYFSDKVQLLVNAIFDLLLIICCIIFWEGPSGKVSFNNHNCVNLQKLSACIKIFDSHDNRHITADNHLSRCSQKQNRHRHKAANIRKVTTYLKHSAKQYSQSAVFLKEPIEKRWYLARFFTSLVSITFFTKRERGDGGKQRTGYTNLPRK